ncbi:hypothetical protein [Phytohalomonas tamaricis]|uniref:hypothetical protein n=1 Tax=Phytohalomonas tamaricis TaxID=2081032 RepID=UPI000D0BB9D4|nr:hypothetical protein [Phytohalomonas tamaricis]
MARESTLSIKEKWALDSQLGEMLRSLEPPRDPEKEFKERLDSLMSEYHMSTDDTVELLGLVSVKEVINNSLNK